jgi:hypothetical protein
MGFELGNISHFTGHANGLSIPGFQPYQPHNIVAKPQGLDWDALTPQCGTCGQRRGDVNLATLTCAVCEKPKPIKVPKHNGPRRGEISAEDVAKAVDLYASGMSMHEVSKEPDATESRCHHPDQCEECIPYPGRTQQRRV